MPITISSTGKTLFDMLVSKVLINEDIKLNCMGIVSDDGANMTGVEKGVISRVKEICNHIVAMKDICHLLNNVFRKALEAIPEDILNIIKDISAHFRRSTQRNALLRQEILEKKLNILEILHLSQTRWLSMRDCIDRILELWPALDSYFQKHGMSTHQGYFTSENELFIRVLSILISHIVDLNEFFQKDDLFYNEVYEKLKHAYVTIANLIIKRTSKCMDFEKVFAIPFESKDIEDIGSLEPEVLELLVTSEEFEALYLSKYDSLKDLLSKVPQGKKDEIYKASIKFLCISLKQMKDNLPYSHQIMKLAQVVFFEDEYNEAKWLTLRDLFPNILKTKKQRDDFATEVRKMEYTYTRLREKIRTSISKVSPVILWKSEAKNYPNMYLLVEALLVLPYSSVPVERVFSSMKDIKTPKRNRLGLDNLEACLLGYQASKSENLHISDPMIESYINKKKVKNIKVVNENPKLSRQPSFEKGINIG